MNILVFYLLIHLILFVLFDLMINLNKIEWLCNDLIEFHEKIQSIIQKIWVEFQWF